MKELIDKSAVVAEIKRRATFFLEESKKENTSDDSSCAVALYGLLSFLDTLEVKEVDLEKELDFNAEVSKFIDTFYKNAKIGHKLMIRRTAKYFYDLGLKAKGE